MTYIQPATEFLACFKLPAGKRAAKTFTRTSVRSHSFATKEEGHDVFAVELDGISSVYGFLRKQQSDTQTYVVRGEFIDAAMNSGASKISRLSKDQPDGRKATLRAVPRRLTAFDIDGFFCPKEVDRHNVEAVYRHAIKYLPGCFHGVSCVIQKSSSYGKSVELGTEKIRLWFWLDRPVDDEDLKHWHDWTPKIIDTSIWAPSQPVYIAKPLFEHGVDRFHSRVTMHKGLQDAVEVPDETYFVERRIAMQSARRIVGTRVREDGEYATGFDDALELIGDGEGKLGFHSPVMSAIGYAFHINGVANDDEWLQSELEQAILAADDGKERAGGANVKTKATYIAGLASAIASIRASHTSQLLEKLDRRRAPTVTLCDGRRTVGEAMDGVVTGAVAALATLQTNNFVQNLEVQYQIAMDRRRAAREVKRELEGRIATADAAGATMPDALELSAEIGLASLEADHEAERCVSELAKARDEARAALKMPRVAIKVPVGVGKTEAAIMSVDLALKEKLRVAYIVPSHRLVDEIAARFERRGVSCAIWRGTDQKDPDNAGEKMCRRSEDVAAIQKSGGKVEDVCTGMGRPEKACMFINECGYRKQKFKQSQLVIFASAAHLRAIPDAVHNGKDTPFDVTFVDEFSVQDFLNYQTVQLRDVTGEVADDVPFGKADRGAAAIILRQLAPLSALFAKEDVITFGDIKTAARAVGFGSDRLKWGHGWRNWRSKLFEARVGVETLVWNNPKEFTAVTRHNQRIMSLQHLCEALAATCDEMTTRAAGATEIAPRLVASVDAKTKAKVLTLTLKRDVHAHWKNSALALLDATLDETIIGWVLPGMDLITNFRVELPGAATINQVNVSKSYSSMGIGANGDAGMARKEAEKIRLAVRMVHCDVRERKVGVIAPREIENMLTSLWLKAGTPLPQAAQTMHFGELRGRNSLEKATNMFVYSRPLPSVTALENITAGLTGRHIEPREQLSKRVAHRRIKGGGLLDCEEYCHPDPDVDRVRRIITDGEVEQAIGRARAINRKTVDDEGKLNTVEIWVLNDLILDHEVVLWELEEFDGKFGLIGGLIDAGIIPHRRGRNEFWQAVTGWKGERIKAHLQRANPTKGSIDQWFERELSAWWPLGCSWRVRIGGFETDVFVAVRGDDTIENVQDRLRNALEKDIDVLARVDKNRRAGID